MYKCHFIQKTAHAVNKTVIHVTNKNSIVTLYNIYGIGLAPQLEETSKYPSSQVLN